MSESSKPLTIQSAHGSYEVHVATGNFAEKLSRIEDVHILADAFFRPHFANHPAQPIFIEATEHAKSLDQIPALIEQLRANGANRQTHLVVIGGGVLQDIATFVASVYMRGIAWSYDPTTVLAMVDSCIGGKSSINVGPYKNLIGTFHTPNPILIDPTLAETLPRDQFASGLIEAAKITFCRGPEAFAAHLATNPSTSMTTASLEALVINSLQSKKHFIEIDEFDKKERLLLNFGHTFGHAIEGASHYGIPHGIAVGLGIVCSFNFQRSRNVDYTNAPIVAQFEQHLDDMIRELPALATELRKLQLPDILNRFASDKKHTSAAYTLILAAQSGSVVLEQIPRSTQLDRDLERAIASTIDTYTQS